MTAVCQWVNQLGYNNVINYNYIASGNGEYDYFQDHVINYNINYPKHGQVFPEQLGRILNSLVNLKYCWNFAPSNYSSLTRLWYAP